MLFKITYNKKICPTYALIFINENINFSRNGDHNYFPPCIKLVLHYIAQKYLGMNRIKLS